MKIKLKKYTTESNIEIKYSNTWIIFPYIRKSWTMNYSKTFYQFDFLFLEIKITIHKKLKNEDN